MDGVPVVDVSPIMAGDRSGIVGAGRELARAFEEIGFASIVGHGIEPDGLDAVRVRLRSLFDQDDEVKRRCRITIDSYRGFVPLGFFTPNAGGRPADHYESYKVQWDCPKGHPVRQQSPLYDAMIWAGVPDRLRDTFHSYWSAVSGVADALVAAVAEGLGIDPAMVLQRLEAPLSNMTLLHYPPHPPSRPGHGIHPHKDTCVLTVLHPDPVGGLEVRGRDGGWIEVDAPEDALVVNVGDMLEIWSGGRLLSTPHRVTNRSGTDRYSAPFFVVPNHAVTVEPLLPPVPGFERDPVQVGPWTAEVWRTNWPDAAPSELDTGAVD